MIKTMLVTGLVLFNLGFFLDICEEAKKSDIIAFLGGGWYDRIDKGIYLYKNGYSGSNKLIYTSWDLFSSKHITFSKKKRMIKSGISENNIVHIDERKVINTYDELKEIKKYLISNKLKKIMIVSHPAHSLRIYLTANLLLDYKKNNLSIINISASDRNWNKYFIYSNFESFKMAYLEIAKIFFNLIKYTFFKKD